MDMLLSRADCRGNKYNATYPHEITVTAGNVAALNDAAKFDHVGAIYLDGHRANKNFVKANVLMMDCDNDASEDFGEWLTPERVRSRCQDLEFYAVPSKSNMIDKRDGTTDKFFSARPRFHYYFPLANTITNAEALRALKEKCLILFPAMDDGAKDGARFFFGVSEPHSEYYQGSQTIEHYLKGIDLVPGEAPAPKSDNRSGEITLGKRHNTLLSEANRLLKRYGETDKARSAYEERVKACKPAIDVRDSERVWSDAVQFYHDEIATAPGYTAPDKFISESLEPLDYTDVGQSRVYADQYGERIRFSRSTDWLVYRGDKWEQSALKARLLSQELTDRQLEEARIRVRKAQDELNAVTESGDVKKIKVAAEHVRNEENFRSYVLGRRKSFKVAATLTEAAPMLEISTDELDHDPFMLNCPTCCIDLRTGTIREHSSDDYFTKITACDLSKDGMDKWREFLKQVTSGDQETEDYLQLVAGMALIGHVYQEKLIVAYGQGGGGKSTFFNTILKVAGDYGMTLSADVLMTDTRRNTRPEMAELRGRRLVVCGELEDGRRLDTGIMKRLVSTDAISAEQKYRDPIVFTPSHNIALFTNHLPKVGTSDSGTWDRLVVVPFNARFRNTKSEIKNYSDVLFNEAGGAILTWMCDGAYKFISSGYSLPEPEAVKEITDEYRRDNDWLGNFLTERCDLNSDYSASASSVFQAYIDFTEDNGERWHRSNAEFKQAMVQAGFNHKKCRDGRMYCGLRLKTTQFKSYYGATPFEAAR